MVKRFNKHTIAIMMVLMLLLNGCTTGKPEKGSGDKLKVYASFYPIYFAAEQIGGNRIDLHSVIPNGSEPHDYEPSMREIADVEGGDVFIYNGVGMESWAEKLSSNLGKKGIRTLNLSQYVDLIKVEEDDDHDDHDDHNHGSYDPHIWLDPTNMDKMAHEIMLEFTKLDQANESFYKKNYEDFSMKLKELDLAYSSGLEKKNNDTILVSHQAFGYLTRRYGLKQISVTGITPHEEPNLGTRAKLIDIIKKNHFEFIFLETLASPNIVDSLAKEENLKILELNPIAGLTEEQQDKKEDYFSIMEQNLENLKKALVK